MHRRVLIADSARKRLDVYRRFLISCGYEVDTAADGIDCLEKLRRSGADVLIMDTSLPWGGADGVLAEVQQMPAADGMPVILLIGDDAEPDGTFLSHRRNVRVLRQPYRLNDLVECLQGVERADRCGAALVK